MNSKIDQKIDVRKFVGELNKLGNRKLNLKVNYYEFPPEDEAIFRNNITREAYSAMQFDFDPIWLRDKRQDWINMNIRELLTDLLHYFYLEIEEARYERIHNYFGPEETVRTDMSRKSEVAENVFVWLRISLGILLFAAALFISFIWFVADFRFHCLGAGLTFLGVYLIFWRVSYALYSAVAWIIIGLFATKIPVSLFWKICIAVGSLWILRQLVKAASHSDESYSDDISGGAEE